MMPQYFRRLGFVRTSRYADYRGAHWPVLIISFARSNATVMRQVDSISSYSTRTDAAFGVMPNMMPCATIHSDWLRCR